MEEFDFKVQIKISDTRKSVYLSVEEDLVEVLVPQSISYDRIKDVIKKKSLWIKTKLKENASKPTFRKKEYISGESFLYLGKNYRLKIKEGDISSVKLIGGNLEVTTQTLQKNREDEVKKLLEDWYRNQAEKRLKEKTKRFSKIIGVHPKSVSIKQFKSRWGSCSAKGELSYNWRIILAPHHIVDYVVVHELCHLLEHNHSQRFWKNVEYFLPDWKERKNCLKNFNERNHNF